MVSTGNKSKLVTSEVCQRCGNCCKVFQFSDRLDFALRFLWIDDRHIKAEDTPFYFDDGSDMKRITIKYPCSQLEFKDGKYRCKAWDKERPDFCNTYPDHNFYNIPTWDKEMIQRVLEYEKKICMGLRDVNVDDVVKMLKEKRGEDYE